MSETRFCKRCGTALPPRAPAGLCPKCLLGQAVRNQPDGVCAEIATESESASIPFVLSGHRLGDYELHERIAAGGMGVIYKARQVSLNRMVALKLISPGRLTSEEGVLRFQAEAKAAASLQHPHIVAIHESGQSEGQHYFSMDYVPGQNLADAVRSQAMPAARAARLLKIIAEAVQYAHDQGILHRDLKPSNIILDEAGEPRITDFGLAKRLGVESELTLTGDVIGSPGFMPPEQAEGRQSGVGTGCDVYGLGAVLYYVLTGRPPFEADSITALLKQLIESEPVRPRLLNPSIPRDLETVCLKCLEKEPPRRYATARELALELGRFIESKPIQARPVGAAGRAWKWCRRRPAFAGLSAGLALSFLLGLAGVLWQWRRATLNELVARQNVYAADMSLAQRTLDASLLDKHRPGGMSKGDLRGWEWRYLWEQCRGDELFRLHRYGDPISAVAVSKDGGLFAVQTERGEVGLWEWAGRRVVTNFTGAGLRALAFSPTDSLLALGDRDAKGQPTVSLWDIKGLTLRSTLNRTSPVRALAFSPDGKTLATFDHRGTVEVIDMESNRVLTQFTNRPPRRSEAGAVAFSPDGHRLLIGADYGLIQMIERPSGRPDTVQTQTRDGVTALAFSPDGKIFAAGFAYTSGTIRLWDSDSRADRGQLTNHTGYVQALAFSSDGEWLASAAADGTIRVWSISDQTEFRCLRGHRNGALTFGPDSRTLVSGCGDGSVYFWDITKASRTSAHTNLTVGPPLDAAAEVEPEGFTPRTLHPKVVRRLGIAFAWDSRSFMATDVDGAGSLWSTQPVQRIERLPMLGTNVWGVALSPNDRWLAVGHASGTVDVWDWRRRQPMKTLSVPFEWCGLVRFSRGGNFLIVKQYFNDISVRIGIWRTSDWAEVSLTVAQEKDIQAADLSPDERHLAAGYTDGSVKLWDFRTGESEGSWRPHTTGVVTVTYSADGRIVASTSFNGRVRLLDAVARRELVPFRGHAESSWGAAFSPDGRCLATGGPGGEDAVRLWDIATGRELLSLAGDGTFFLDVRFSGDGNILSATSMDGIAHLWRAPSWGEIQAAEKRYQFE